VVSDNSISSLPVTDQLRVRHQSNLTAALPSSLIHRLKIELANESDLYLFGDYFFYSVKPL